MIYQGISRLFEFPEVESATKEGIVAVGGNLSPEMLISAYSQGIFPWFSENDPIIWWSPDPRFVLYIPKLHVSRSMKKIINKKVFRISVDTCFEAVIKNCGAISRPGQDGTWIVDGMVEAYTRLHELGYAHSVEVWDQDELVGGLYGVSLGNLFFGESMFSLLPNASKAGFIPFVSFLESRGFDLVDCQVHTPHLESLGAENISREEFMLILNEGLKHPSINGPWTELAGKYFDSFSI